MNPSDNFIDLYLEYCKDTEPPTIYHRWCALVGIAALLGRNAYIQHGHFKVFPNMYSLIVGESGARKGTAIKMMCGLLREAEYEFFAPNRASQEQFMADLYVGMNKIGTEDEKLDTSENKTQTMKELFGVDSDDSARECFIALDEFNTFMGHGNINFITCLTDLWNYEGKYKYRFRNGKSVLVPNPTINILGGITSVGLSQAFPVEVIGQGFFSRILMIFSDPSGKKITRIPTPDLKLKAQLVTILQRIKNFIQGELYISEDAWTMLDEIYQNYKELKDVRFKSYSTRRFDNLLKLCMVVAASRVTGNIDTSCVEYANTILHYTEYFMPRALGEFGKARNSDVAVKILELLEKADKPLDIAKDIWPNVRRDLDSAKQLEEILRGLHQADKIQMVKAGILPKKEEPRFDYIHCRVELLKEWREYQFKMGLL